MYAALGVWEGAPQEDRLPDRRRGEGIGPVALAAEQAVRDPGTEVSATEIAGQPRGPRGRWAKLLRRPRNPLPVRRAAETGGKPAAGPVEKPGPQLESPQVPRADTPDARRLDHEPLDGETKATPEPSAEPHTIVGD